MPAEQHTHKHFSGARLLAKWVQDNSRLAGWRAGWTSMLPAGILILEQGDESSAQEAAKYVSELNTAIDVPTKVWRHDVVGYFPDIPLPCLATLKRCGYRMRHAPTVRH
jgi:hypothetical protein